MRVGRRGVRSVWCIWTGGVTGGKILQAPSEAHSPPSSRPRVCPGLNVVKVTLGLNSVQDAS